MNSRDRMMRMRRVLSRLLCAFDNDLATAAQLRKCYAQVIADAEELLRDDDEDTCNDCNPS